jgi:hypothetical protein
VVALPSTAGGYAYSNGYAVLFGGSAAHTKLGYSKITDGASFDFQPAFRGHHSIYSGFSKNFCYLCGKN